MPRTKVKMLNGDRLKDMREKKHMSQQMLADTVELSVRQISRYETNPKPVDVSASTLVKLSNALGCSTDYLLGLVDEPTAHVPDIPAEILKWARLFADLPKPLKDAIRAIVRSQTANGNSH